ncbi:hypothetical protein [Micromonospora sp. S4605]|uniref:hypothetical protein n=1 Tax=Micromonospora sp. S4605 TaxID=1420897 RepID=UPI0011B61347|nr:hypothetical protein [Micromonospora sp. S4605]
MLGSCQVGKVWSAVDAQGRAVTVAVLDAPVAADQRWREAFASTANALKGRDGRPNFLHADFSAPEPWVTYAADSGTRAEQIFVALDLEYHPTSAAAPVQHGATPADGGQQHSTAPVEETPEDHGPTSGAEWPVSTPPSPVSVPPSSEPHSPSQWQTADTTSYPALRSVAPTRPRRTGLWVGVAVAVVVALGAGVGFFAWQSGDRTPAAGSSPSPSATVPSSPEPVAFPTGAPRNPGVEPPKPGSWPAEPQFADTDRVRAESPAGLGFTFKVPESWACDARQRGPGFARYLCGISRPGVPEVGGEVIVRNCPKPCGEEVQAAYRKAEEAWGLQWVQAGNVTFAETSQINGKDRYGLVVIGWWRSTPDGVIDRQVVIRMTATGAQVSEVRKVANGIRATLSL